MVDIRRLSVGDEALVATGQALFDGPADPRATARFLATPDHHLFYALDDDGRPVGFVSGVEVTHPDKGTEMFLYELGVDEGHRRQGIGLALVTALRDLAIELGCYGMWVLTDDDNVAAVETYRAAGADRPEATVLMNWALRSAGS